MAVDDDIRSMMKIFVSVSYLLKVSIIFLIFLFIGFSPLRQVQPSVKRAGCEWLRGVSYRARFPENESFTTSISTT